MEIINLDMTPSTVTPNAHAGQYDSARTVRFMLKNGGVPFTLAGTETITAEITRSDNTEVTVNVANTSSNYVDVVFDDTVCTVKGLYACELRVVDGGVDIGSKNFALLVQRDPYDGAGVRVETVGPADVCAFETTLPEPLQSLTVNVEATGGNGTPDNPIPINGYTEANIVRCGANIININGTEFAELQNPDVAIPFVDNLVIKGLSRDGYVRPANVSYSVSGDKVTINTSSSSYGVGFAFRAIPNTDYYVSCSNSFGSTSVYYDKDGKWIGDSGAYVSENNSFTTPNNCAWCVIILKPNSINVDTDFNEPLVNFGTTKATYHPYTGNTYAIAFGQTVYGGVLDATRGKLHVTWGDNDLGDLTWVKDTTTVVGKTIFRAQLTNAKNAFIAKCSIYPYMGSYSNLVDKSCAYIYNTRIAVQDEDYDNSSADDFKTAVTGQRLIYELATPFDIDLTPEVISAIVGTNNVFAECGETEVKYLKAGA